jgi:hypothetical protein
MIGLFVLGIAALWLGVAVWMGQVISKWIIKRFVNRAAEETTLRQRLVYLSSWVMITTFVLFLPFVDQLIAYPKWQQLCSTTGDIEWAPGMDEKKAYGRQLVVRNKAHEVNLFPGLRGNYYSKEFEDIETGELILIMPHYWYVKPVPMIELPSSEGGAGAIFLDNCMTSRSSVKIKKILLENNLGVVGYMRGNKLILD